MAEQQANQGDNGIVADIGKFGGLIGAFLSVVTIIGWIASRDGDTIALGLTIAGGVYLAVVAILVPIGYTRGDPTWDDG
jgi:hypothetical protein